MFCFSPNLMSQLEQIIVVDKNRFSESQTKNMCKKTMFDENINDKQENKKNNT